MENNRSDVAMDRTKLVSAVESALSEVLERDVTGLTDDTRLFEDMHLDSTSVLELLMALEDIAGISVDPETLDMDDFRSVGTLTSYMAAQQATPPVDA
jgi:acyl carrier protein